MGPEQDSVWIAAPAPNTRQSKDEMSGAGHIIDDRYDLPTDKSLLSGAVTLDETSFLFERLTRLLRHQGP
jgi:hypothetical protein